MQFNEINLSILKLITSLSGYMHDFGKANELFQSKIRNTNTSKDLTDVIRHEFLSFYIVLKLVDIYEKEIINNKEALFITQDKWNNIFNDFEFAKNSNKDFISFKKSIQSLIEYKNNYYNFNQSNELNPMTLCILLCILTHHKLPCSVQKDMKTSLFSSSISYDNLNHIYNISSSDFDKLKKNLKLHSKYYISEVLENNINKGFNDIYNNSRELLKYSLEDKKIFFKSFSIFSRIFLIMADHHVSSIIKNKLPIEGNNETYANTNRDFNDLIVIPTFNQTLNEHLLEVGDTTINFLNETLDINNNLPSLSNDSISNIMQETTNEDFKWQDEVVDFIKKENEKSIHTQTTLILNMGTTGSGKTRMNVKALGALNNEKLRITSVFNLKSLTLQTGEAYKKQLKLQDNEISVLIGDKNYLDIQKLDNNIEELKLDNDTQSTEQEYLINGNFDSNNDWTLRPSFIKNKQKNGYKIDDFIGVPVLVSTIDFCINAGDLSKGSNHNNSFLRIMTSDLIIDEIDSYEPEMIESVLRLITIAAMNKRNIVISSATLSKHYITMIKKSFQHGIELSNMLYGVKEEGKIICISNLIDSKCINNDSDINNYIDSLCQKFKNNKQKMATILKLNLEKNTDTPPIFKYIKELHLNHHQILDDKKFSFGLIRVGSIKNAVRFSQKYFNTDFNKEMYQINNESVEVKFLTYHSNLLNSNRFVIEEFLDNTLNQNSGKIENKEVFNIVNQSKAKHVIFIIIATPVEEIGRDHDFYWEIIEPSSIQSIIQTAGRANRHRKITVEKPNIYILQYNLSYYYNHKIEWISTYFTKPGLEKKENKYEQDIEKLLPWEYSESQPYLYITSELRYNSEFARLDEQSIYLSLSELNYKFSDNENNHWFRLEYYYLNKLRNSDSDNYTYIVDNNKGTFHQTSKQYINNKEIIGNEKYIDKLCDYKNALILDKSKYYKLITNNDSLTKWSLECNVNIYNDKQKENIKYHDIFGFYFGE